MRFDRHMPETERLPRSFEVEFRPDGDGVRLLVDGSAVGDRIVDCSREPDGYRYHDVYHLAFAAVLGWSPVLRSMLGRKRRSDPDLDLVEDGGRAIAVEEGIVALAFAYAKDHVRIAQADPELLSAVRRMASHLEVRKCSEADWDAALVMGQAVWSELSSLPGRGVVDVDLDEGRLGFKVREMLG